MPFVSRAQQRWGHTAAGEKALGGAGAVHEWDEATKGAKLPARTQRYSGHNSPPYDKPSPTKDAGDRSPQYKNLTQRSERPTKPKGDRSPQWNLARDGNNYPAPAGDEALPGPRGAERSRTAGSTRQSLDPPPGLKNWRAKTNSGGREFDGSVRNIPRNIKGPKSTSDRFQAETKKPARGRDRQDNRAPASVGQPDQVPGRVTAGLVDPTTSDMAGSIRGSEAKNRMGSLFRAGMISSKAARRMTRDRSKDDDGDYAPYKTSY